MYVALLLMMAGACGVRKTALAIGAWLLLLVVLWLKARAEESLLATTFPEYAAYRARTCF
jgi:protein-S-isoprenylcysteine O-methyltransferase Ste14